MCCIGQNTPSSTPRRVRRRRLRRFPHYTNEWEIGVLYGPHGAPDFFTPDDIEMFFSTAWKVHYNSDRTGVRLIGPKPEWARKDGGEAGLHPSNIHDNAYAVGTVDFTGDMPVILGPDGPSLGGFVCPATIVQAELWKMGQLKPGDPGPLPRDFETRQAAMEEEMDRGCADDLRSFRRCRRRPARAAACRTRPSGAASPRASSAAPTATAICSSNTGPTCSI